MLDTYLKWFQSHERLILVAVVLTFGYFGLGKWLDKSATDKAMQAAVAQQIASVQHDADQKVAAAVAQQTALFEQERQVHDQEIASLVAAVTSRDTATTKKITQVTSTTTSPEAVADLNTAYGATLPTPLTVTEAGSIPIADLQQFTVAKIEEDTLQSDLADTRKELGSTSLELSSATSLVGSLQNQVTGLQLEIKDNTIASQKQIAAVKADARKGKMTWFKIGFVTGFVSGLWTGHAL